MSRNLSLYNLLPKFEKPPSLMLRNDFSIHCRIGSNGFLCESDEGTSVKSRRKWEEMAPRIWRRLEKEKEILKSELYWKRGSLGDWGREMGNRTSWRTIERQPCECEMTRFSEISRRFYVLNSVVPFEEDATHEFKGHRNITAEEVPPWCYIPGTDKRSRKAVSRYLNKRLGFWFVDKDFLKLNGILSFININDRLSMPNTDWGNAHVIIHSWYRTHVGLSRDRQ